MPIGFRFFIAARRVAAVDVLLPSKLDLADFDLGSFLDHEREPDRDGRNLADFGPDGGELAAVLGQQFFHHDFGLLNLGRIVLASGESPTFASLKRSRTSLVVTELRPV